MNIHPEESSRTGNSH